MTENAENRDVDFSKLEQAEPSAENKGEVSELSTLEAQLAESKDKYLRALADFENFKKRTTKERSELIKYQGERIFADVLDVLDDLELALKYSGAEPEKLKSGLELIHKKFVAVLSKWEVRGESQIGKDFDPNLHRSFSEVQSEDAKAGTILDELKKPYFYKDRLIRVGEVVIAAAKKGTEG